MSEIRLNVERQCLRIDDRKYFYEKKEYGDSDYDDDGDLRWYKEDKRYAEADYRLGSESGASSEHDGGKLIPVAEAEEIDPTGTEWRYARKEIKDPSKIKKLDRKLKRAESEAKAEETAKQKADKER